MVRIAITLPLPSETGAGIRYDHITVKQYSGAADTELNSTTMMLINQSDWPFVLPTLQFSSLEVRAVQNDITWFSEKVLVDGDPVTGGATLSLIFAEDWTLKEPADKSYTLSRKSPAQGAKDQVSKVVTLHLPRRETAPAATRAKDTECIIL